jgi:hypothetical protein
MLRRSVFGTPSNFSLLLATRLPQQFAIAATHQGEATLDKADRAVTQVVGFPGPFGNTFGSEQNLGDHAIGVAIGSRIERAKRQGQSLPALRRQFVEGRARCAAVERTPEAARGMRPNVEVIVKWQFGGVRPTCHWRFAQPEPMLDPANAQQNMPAVRRLTEFACRQISQTEHIPVRHGCASNDRNNCRQGFRCPEYCLILRRPRRVSGESRGPISF